MDADTTKAIELKDAEGTTATFKFSTVVVVDALPVYEAPDAKRRRLLAETTSYKDWWQSFDLSAFPLPMRIGPRGPELGICWECGGQALHVFMKIKPRNEHELQGCTRDANGHVELNTCSHVTESEFWQMGALDATEAVRHTIRNLVLHELAESILFREFRLYDPHEYSLKPEDQPW